MRPSVIQTHKRHAMKRNKNSILEPNFEQPSEEIESVQGDGREDPWLSIRGVIGDGCEEAYEGDEAAVRYKRSQSRRCSRRGRGETD